MKNLLLTTYLLALLVISSGNLTCQTFSLNFDPPENVQATAITNHILVNWEPPSNGKALTGYNVYRNDTLIATNIPDTTFWNYHIYPGNLDYCISAQYDGGESVKVCDIIEVATFFPPPDALLATIENGNTVCFEVETPSLDPEVIKWHDGQNSGAFGLPNGGTFSVASLFSPAELSGLEGYYLTAMNFYLVDTAADFVAKIWQGANADTLLAEQPLTAQIVPGWNAIELIPPILIDVTQELWTGYQVTHQAGTMPAGYDYGPPIIGKGDMISIDGVNWQSATIAYNLSGNWNITTIAAPPTGSVPGNNILGFNLYRDGVFIGPLIDPCIFDHPQGTYEYCASIVYDLGESELTCATPISVPLAPPENLNSDIYGVYALTTWLPPSQGGIPEGYIIYRNQDSLDFTTQNYYEDFDLTPGDYQYCVSSLYPGGESQQVCGDTLNCFLSPPDTLTLDLMNYSNIKLEWPMIYPHPEWIHYDDSINADGVGVTGGGTFYTAIRFTPNDLIDFSDFFLTKVNFFCNDYYSNFVLKVWQGENAANEVISQNLTGLNSPGWNEIDLVSPHLIDISQELWIGYEVSHPPDYFPAGTDIGPAVANYGDMISLDVSNWESMSIGYGLNLNWNIQAYVSPIPSNENEKLNTPGILGYNIYRFDDYIDFTTGTIYIDIDGANYGSQVDYCISTLYNQGESELLCDSIFIESINELQIEQLSVKPNPASSQLWIKNPNQKIKYFEIRDLTGRTVHKKAINRKETMIDVRNYDAGIYLIKALINGKWHYERFIVN